IAFMRRFWMVFVALSLQAQGLWETRSPYPIQLTEISGAAIDGQLYMLCGLTQTGSTTQAFSYDISRDTWSPIAAMPIAGGADHCNVAAVGGNVYLLGGIRVGAIFADGATWRYSPQRNAWDRVAEMTTPRGASGVAVIGNRIYVAGGLGRNGEVLSTFEVFDT